MFLITNWKKPKAICARRDMVEKKKNIHLPLGDYYAPRHKSTSLFLFLFIYLSIDLCMI